MIIRRVFSRVRSFLANELLKMRAKINKQFKPGSTMWKIGYVRALEWLGKEKIRRGVI